MKTQILGSLALFALVHAANGQVTGPLFERPLRKDPVIIPAVANAGYLSAEGDEVQFLLTRGSNGTYGFSDLGRSVQLNADTGEVLSSKRGGVHNPEGFSFISTLTDSGQTCFGSCVYLGFEIQAFDPEDRPLWRVFGLPLSFADLTTNAFSPALVANGVARDAARGARVLSDRNCRVHLALANGHLLSCIDSPTILKYWGARSGIVWTVDGAIPNSVVISPDGSRSAVLTTDGRVRVLDIASGNTQLLSMPFVIPALSQFSWQMVWATRERLYLRTETDLVAIAGAGAATTVLWQRSFAALAARPGLVGSDELGRIYVPNLTADGGIKQISLDGNSSRLALTGLRYYRTRAMGPHRFGRTLVEALASGELRGIDRDTGVERWRKSSISPPLPQQTAASVLGDALYVASVATVANSELQLRLDKYDANGLPVETDTPFRAVTLEAAFSFQTLLAPVAAGSKVIVAALQGVGSTSVMKLVGYQQGQRLWQTTSTGLCSNGQPLVVQANEDFVVVGMYPFGPVDIRCRARVFNAHTGAYLRESPLIALLPGTSQALAPSFTSAASSIVDLRSGAPVSTLPKGLGVIQLDLVGKRMLAGGAGVYTSLDFDGRVRATLTLPPQVSVRSSFALDGLVLLELSEGEGLTPFTAAFDLNTGLERWRVSPALPRSGVKWLKSGERWRYTRGVPVSQTGQRIRSAELDPLTGEVGYRNVGFSSAHSERFANPLVGELPGRIYFHSGVATYNRGMLTGWAAPLNPNWARDAQVDLQVRELLRTRTASGGLRVRMQLANRGPDTANAAALSAATLDDLHTITVSACSASNATCPALGAAPPTNLDLPVGGVLEIEFDIPASAASDIDSKTRERLRVSLLPRLQDLDANLVDNEYGATLYDGVFRDAFEY